MKFIIPLLVFVLLIAVVYWNTINPSNNTSNQLNQSQSTPSKRVVVIIIDSLMDRPLQSIDKENIPAIQFLLRNGNYYPEMISSYPTMSVVVDSTFLTGTYADQHKVPALVWYDTREERFISYGSAQLEIMKIGPKQVLNDSVFHLNHKHLSPNVKTIHEELGGQTSSINALVYRGKHTKQLNVPELASIINLLEKNSSVKGTNYFSYGLLSKIDPKNKHTHLWEAFGFNDKFATHELKYLIENNRLPDFSFVYFSDNDKKVHKSGENVTEGIIDADKQLQSVFNSYSSWEDAFKDTVWIVMGDSGQTNIVDNKDLALIDLRKLLRDYQIYKIGEPVQDRDEVVLALNERMSFIYLIDENISKKDIVDVLLDDDRIDHIAWKDGEKINVISIDHKGAFSYKPNGEYQDQYGQTWSLQGNINILDLKINKDNIIMYNDYPDALARLYSSFHSHPGNYLVVNAKPGFEFVGEGSPTHIGGASHGSLHKQDTYFPMIVAGTDQKPKHERILDMKEWILRILEASN